MSFFLPDPDDLAKSRHAAVGAWFFGPRAENFDHLKSIFGEILDRQKDARTSIYPNDSEFITAKMKDAPLYKRQIAWLNSQLRVILKELDWHSVPFWSPRYNAHMSMETSMPSMIGYLAGLLHNQNNVATEASPFTTLLEKQVGIQLCHMLGYDVSRGNRAQAWGHITCGGSVANLESIWTARNLKFYPLSLKLALETGPLSYIKQDFEIETCDGTLRRFVDCTTWELLNLKPSTVLNIPDQLYDQFGVSATFLGKALTPWSIQTVGKDFLEKRFGISEPPQILITTTKHYSWPKGAAIAGIGSAQVVDVPVDYQARMDPQELYRMLQQRLDRKQAVYSVVAIIGSTEHGACDPLADILEIRREFQARGLSFVVHCDGAWGGYFASCIREKATQFDGLYNGDPAYVPTLALSPYTKKQLEAYKDADSITIDPHKSGYCPYPAGGMCYRDGRMRFLVTWTSPVIYRDASQDNIESIGVYGVEGSKPGAAAVGAWLSHTVIGLNEKGYGSLLGEAVYTCSRLYCHWATMDLAPIKVGNATARLIVTPFIMLPAERLGLSTKEIKDQKEFIVKNILNKSNEEIFENEKARQLIALLGGDLMINAFACNFEIDGKVNQDVLEANLLNTYIFSKTSITKVSDDVTQVPLFLTSTSFAQSTYKGCLDTYKRRMGLPLGPEDLYSLINVTMGPWSTSNNFVGHLAKEFEAIADDALKYIVHRNAPSPDHHGFVIQGLKGDRICGVHLPMFSMANHRWQLIISCKIPEKEQKILQDLSKKDPTLFFTFGNLEKEVLDTLLERGSFKARLDKLIPDEKTDPLANITVSDVKVLYRRSMQNRDLASTYPDRMIFYAYSAQRDTEQSPIFHIDHLLSVSPNIQLCADSITFKTKDAKAQQDAETHVRGSGCWFRLTKVFESIIQPLTQAKNTPRNNYQSGGLKFVPGQEFEFEALEFTGTPPTDYAPILFTGVLKLGPSMFADAYYLNEDVHTETKSRPSSHGANTGMGGPGLALETMNYGLVAEYPNEDGSQEAKIMHRQSVMQEYNNHFLQARANEARKVFEAEEGELPDGVKQLCEQADALKATLASTIRPNRLYMGHH